MLHLLNLRLHSLSLSILSTGENRDSVTTTRSHFCCSNFDSDPDANRHLQIDFISLIQKVGRLDQQAITTTLLDLVSRRYSSSALQCCSRYNAFHILSSDSSAQTCHFYSHTNIRSRPVGACIYSFSTVHDIGRLHIILSHGIVTIATTIQITETGSPARSILRLVRMYAISI